MMYQDIYTCICQNTKKMKIYYPVCQTYSPAQLVFKNRFPKGGPTCRRQVVNPRHQTSQGQSVAKPETPLHVYKFWICNRVNSLTYNDLSSCYYTSYSWIHHLRFQTFCLLAVYYGGHGPVSLVKCEFALCFQSITNTAFSSTGACWT